MRKHRPFFVAFRSPLPKHRRMIVTILAGAALLHTSQPNIDPSVEPDTTVPTVGTVVDSVDRPAQVRAVDAIVASGNKRHMLTELQTLADGGNGYAAWQLGVFLDTGQHDIPVDPARAFRLFTIAAAQGEANAHVSLGLMHALGRGTPVDYAASMRSYRAGADAGEAHGYYGIGVLHASGQGVVSDPSVALSYFLVAAAMGDPEAGRPIHILTRAQSPEKAGEAVGAANAMLAAAGSRVIIKHDENGYSQEQLPAVQP